MKALVKADRGIGLVLQEVPIPELGPNDVLIRVLKTSICGTDAHIWKWNDWAQKTIPVPLVVGHEFVGVISKAGSNVNDHFPGELVCGEGHVVCGRCRNCLAGRRHLCPHTEGVGVNRPGAFAEYLKIPVANVWHADPNIPLEVLCCFDPLGNATHTALQFDVLGEDVLITGAGPIGCMAVAIARHCSARHIVVTDPVAERREMALRMGATRAVDPRTSLPELQSELGMQEGFDVGMEMSGHPDALRQMLANMCHGGKVSLLGILPECAIDWNLVVFNMLTIRGIYGREMFETWYKMTMMIQCGLDITPIITHRFDYTEFEQAFEIMCSGHSGKVLLNWSEQE